VSKPVEIIAEFCQNHNGDFDILARMVEAAAKNGASHGKIQAIFAEEVAFRPQFEQGLVEDGVTLAIKRPYQAEHDRLKALEINFEQAAKFATLCVEVGIKPMTTCFTRAQVEPLAQAGFKEIKVASYDCSAFAMLRELKARFARVIVSTGATYDDEVRFAAEILKGHDFGMLHCVTLYPTPLAQVHMARMDWLRSLAPQVGYSDHSAVGQDPQMVGTKAAMHLGAEIVERHFTILPAGETRDGPVSITPDMLADLVRFAALDKAAQAKALDEADPNWRVCIGSGDRKLSDQELLNRDYYRGRFASPRPESAKGRRMIFNWEEVPLS
jgi:N,N'-diacetyllegionaminate synthase